MPIIDTTMYKNSFQSVKKTAEENSTLGKDDFLRILITQLQNQDPTQPLQDREFIAQMAQFSSLEQMTNMNKMLSVMAEFQTLGSLSSMVGKQVTWTEQVKEVDAEGEETSKDVPKQGIVQSISMKDGKAEFIMEDGSKVGIGLVETLGSVKTSTETNTEPTS